MKEIFLCLSIFIFISGKSMALAEGSYQKFLVRNMADEDIEYAVAYRNWDAIRKHQAFEFKPGNRITFLVVADRRPCAGPVRYGWTWGKGKPKESGTAHFRQVGQKFICYSAFVLDTNFVKSILGHEYAGDWTVGLEKDDFKVEENFIISR